MIHETLAAHPLAALVVMLVLVAVGVVAWVLTSRPTQPPSSGEPLANADPVTVGEPDDGTDYVEPSSGEPLADADPVTVEEPDDGTDYVEVTPPLRSSKSWLRGLWQYHKQQTALRKRGYVQWYLVGSGWPRPKYVKPKYNNAGVPEVEYDGDWYLFPEAAATPDDESGMWTYIHRVGDAKPIDPRDPEHEPLDADTLADYGTRRPAASKPGWLSKFDFGGIDPQTMLVLFVILAVFWQVFM